MGGGKKETSLVFSAFSTFSKYCWTQHTALPAKEHRIGFAVVHLKKDISPHIQIIVAIRQASAGRHTYPLPVIFIAWPLGATMPIAQIPTYLFYLAGLHANTLLQLCHLVSECVNYMAKSASTLTSFGARLVTCINWLSTCSWKCASEPLTEPSVSAQALFLMSHW